MQNWYCLVHFPDGSEEVHLIPGPAPIVEPGKKAPIITVLGKPDLWRVTDSLTRAHGNEYAAEIWVESYELA